MRTRLLRALVSLPALGLALAAALPQAATAQTAGAPVARLVGGPEVGSRAPDFKLPWANKDTVGAAEQPFELWKTAGKVVVLAFYPKDFTSGCTAELKTFSEQYAEMFGPDVVVLGISADSVETHRRFAASVGAPFMLLSDPDQSVAKKYASAGDNGYNRRTVFVIGKDGKVSYRDMKFGALDPDAYARLKTAVRKSRDAA